MEDSLIDLPSGPLDVYRKKASFNWKDMLRFIDGEDNIIFKVTSDSLKLSLSKAWLKRFIFQIPANYNAKRLKPFISGKCNELIDLLTEAQKMTSETGINRLHQTKMGGRTPHTPKSKEVERVCSKCSFMSLHLILKTISSFELFTYILHRLMWCWWTSQRPHVMFYFENPLNSLWHFCD